MPDERLIAESVRVFVVWDTDASGASLYGIYSTLKGAEKARLTFRNDSWIEEWEVSQ